MKEPSDLVRVDGKRPDGSTLILWHAGEAMAWDVTIVNTLAESYSTVSASPGGAAEHAAARKTSKYSSLPASHMFQPLALQTLGPINSSGISFLVELGRRLMDVSGDARETIFSTSFPGGPALQFGSLQRNIYSSYRTGLAPRHSS